MNIELDNGDIQLGDYSFRMSPEYTNIIYLITNACNLSCPYCIARTHRQGHSLLDNYDPETLAGWFHTLQEKWGRKIHLIISGGEPTIAPNFPEFCNSLSGIPFGIETNLCTPAIERIAATIDPQAISFIMATYHWSVIQHSALNELYFSNFITLKNAGFPLALKIIALPDSLEQLPPLIEQLQEYLGKDFLIYVHSFFSWGDRGTKGFPTAWPYLYNQEDQKKILELGKVRKTEEAAIFNRAGWFEGMQCNAGSKIILIDTFGKATPCYARKTNLGTLVEANIDLLQEPIPCPSPYCSCIVWGLWYGLNPWHYFDWESFPEMATKQYNPRAGN